MNMGCTYILKPRTVSAILPCEKGGGLTRHTHVPNKQQTVLIRSTWHMAQCAMCSLTNPISIEDSKTEWNKLIGDEIAVRDLKRLYLQYHLVLGGDNDQSVARHDNDVVFLRVAGDLQMCVRKSC